MMLTLDQIIETFGPLPLLVVTCLVLLAVSVGVYIALLIWRTNRRAADLLRHLNS